MLRIGPTMTVGGTYLHSDLGWAYHPPSAGEGGVSMRGLMSESRSGLSRRGFLRGSAAALGGALIAGPAYAQECRPTDGDILGPFYRFGAPFQSQLAGSDE